MLELQSKIGANPCASIAPVGCLIGLCAGTRIHRSRLDKCVASFPSHGDRGKRRTATSRQRRRTAAEDKIKIGAYSFLFVFA